jgi:tetratricopeptide (TPR) repeat protein
MPGAGVVIRVGLWRRLAGAIVVLVAGAALAWTFRHALPGPLRATSFPAPREAPPTSRFVRADFVGADRCARCHSAEYTAWSASTHGRAGGAPAPGRVIAAFDGKPIRFRDAVVTPRMRGGSYEFVIAPDADTVQVIRVDGVIGGGHMRGGGTQGFVTRRADGTYRFVPFDWSRSAGGWFCNTNSRANAGWAPVTERMRLADCGDWPPVRMLGDVPRWANCQGCHASQLRVEDAGTGRSTNFTTNFTSLAINCESCHGPGRRHVDLAERGALSTGDIGMTSLRTLQKDASLDVCFQCHAVKDQLREGFISGDSLAQFYSIGLPALGERPLHPDGRTRTFAYQEAHRYSDCYVNGGMTCTSCHDPHSQGYRTVTGQPLADRFDDRQCTSCHASKATATSGHTHHSVGSAGIRCTSCHMQYLQQPETANPRTGAAPITYARSDHSISIPRPRADSALGVRNACAACHSGRSTAQLEDETRRLWGPGKPVPAQIAVQLRMTESRQRDSSSASGDAPARGELLWRPGNASRPHVAATIAGVAAYLDLVSRPDDRPPERRDIDSLTALAADPNLDVRALALATLDLTAGNDRSVRRTMVKELHREAPHDYGLRVRWALALGYKGDAWLESGNTAEAAEAYRRALEVLPGDAALWGSLGNAARALGNHDVALASYETAVRLRPTWGLAWVNVGITRLALGDSAGGIAAFRTATEREPGEPLGWFNLGNVVLARGGLDDALGMFRRAVELDASLVDAHFQIARIYLLRRNITEAYAALRRGLAFDTTNAAARALAAELRAGHR